MNGYVFACKMTFAVIDRWLRLYNFR